MAPDPDTAPGLMVQAPTGNPVNCTDPVAEAQVVCVMVPMIGADGVVGCVLIVAFEEAGDGHPIELVTVKV